MNTDATVQAIYEGMHDATCITHGPHCEEHAAQIRDAIRVGLQRVGLDAAETRTEYGARFEDGEVMLRPDREFAMNTVRAIRHRGGTSALMVRQITTTDWTEAEET